MNGHRPEQGGFGLSRKELTQWAIRAMLGTTLVAAGAEVVKAQDVDTDVPPAQSEAAPEGVEVAQSQEPTASPEATKYIATLQGNVRTAASVSAALSKEIPMGAELILTNVSEGWYEVKTYNGIEPSQPLYVHTLAIGGVPEEAPIAAPTAEAAPEPSMTDAEGHEVGPTEPAEVIYSVVDNENGFDLSQARLLDGDNSQPSNIVLMGVQGSNPASLEYKLGGQWEGKELDVQGFDHEVKVQILMAIRTAEALTEIKVDGVAGTITEPLTREAAEALLANGKSLTVKMLVPNHSQTNITTESNKAEQREQYVEVDLRKGIALVLLGNVSRESLRDEHTFIKPVSWGPNGEFAWGQGFTVSQDGRLVFALASVCYDNHAKLEQSVVNTMTAKTSFFFIQLIQQIAFRGEDSGGPFNLDLDISDMEPRKYINIESDATAVQVAQALGIPYSGGSSGVRSFLIDNWKKNPETTSGLATFVPNLQE